MNTLKKLSIAMAGAIAIALGTVGAAQAATSDLSGGNVLSPDATPEGFSLTDLARLIAPFQDTIDASLLPNNTPFQILYIPTSNSTSNSFTVNSNTFFYVPFSSINDSPPILGTFPSDPSQSAFYFFDKSQFGGHDFTITVDGKTTPIGPEYLAEPVTTAPLPNGGTNTIVLATFLSALNPGQHTVEIKGVFDGAFLGGETSSEDIVYTIQSVPESSSVVGVLMFGALGAGAALKRKQQQQDQAKV